MAFHDAVLDAAPLYYLRCNELGGTTLADATGNGHTATVAGGYSLGDAPMADGTVKAIALPSGHVQQSSFGGVVPSGDYTLMMVARWSGGGQGILFAQTEASSPYRGITIFTNHNGATDATQVGSVSFRERYFDAAYQVTVAGAYNSNAFRIWHFVRRGSSLEIWVGGELIATAALPSVGVPPSVTEMIAMGAPGSFYVGGALDEMALFHTALSEAQITLQAALAADAGVLRGTATLDNGSAASKVVARKWDSHEHRGETVPAVDGTWEMFLPNGDYDVTVFGPAGYQPITHGPVTTVEL